MKKATYLEFRTRFDEIFGGVERQFSVSHQLIDLTDLFQKIAAVYSFASTHRETSFNNPIIFQITESALVYGVCMPIRRLADGSQRNEVSLFRVVNEIRTQCRAWNRAEFVTWDGSPYDPSDLHREHQQKEQAIIHEMIKKGESGGWLPTGKHEEIYRRHKLFDLLCGNSAVAARSEEECWRTTVPDYLLRLLKESAREVVSFANVHLAHRIHFPPERKPEFNISLNKMEESIIGLWNCYNVLNSLFYDSYMTPDIVHSLRSFEHLQLPLVQENAERSFIDRYEVIKDRMEKSVNAHSFKWEKDLLAEILCVQ